MAHVMNRNKDALEVLYDRYSSAVMGLAYRILQNRQTAEEVVQETFWRVWERADSFSPNRGTFTSWLFTIAHRYAIDLTRRAKVRPSAAISEADVEIMQNSASDENVLTAVSASIQSQTLKSAISNLPPEQIEVIRMAYYEGLTRKEIADATQTPVGTIHTRARLALRKLYALLQSEGIES